MRKLMFRAVLITAAVAMMVSCNKDNENKPGGNDGAPAISFKQAGNIQLTFEAGTTTVEYTVTNPVENATVEADAEGAEWISNFDTSVEGALTFSVTENTEAEARSVVLTLKYIYDGGEAKAQINVIQDANLLAYDFTASYGFGYYYGNRHGKSPAMMYYTWLTENPSEGGYLGAGMNYCFSIFAAAPEDMSAIAAPAGTYTLADTFAEGTFDIGESRFLNGDDGSALYFTEGTLVITKDGDKYVYEASLVDQNGGAHRVKYTGPMSLQDDSAEPTYSTLTDDYTANLSNAACIAAYYGDYYGKGNSNFTVQIMPDGAGDAITMDIFCPSSSNATTGLAEGEYSIADTGNDFTLLNGYLSGGYLVGTWFVTLNASSQAVDPMAPLMSGTVNISKDGSAVTIEIEAKDDLDPANTVTATWTGEITYYDQTQQAPAAAKANIPYRNNGVKVSARLF